MTNSSDPQIFEVRVINLERSQDRLRSISLDLQSANLKWERFPAVSGVQMQVALAAGYDPKTATTKYDRLLTAGELGCTLSHLGGLQAFLEGPSEYLLLLEDDSSVPKQTNQFVTEFIEHAEKIRPDWHYANFCNVYAKRRKLTGVIGQFKVYRAFQVPVLSNAVIWSRVGAAQFLDWIGRRGFSGAIDVEIREFIARYGTGFSIDPPPMPPKCLASEIETYGSRPVRDNTVPTHRRIRSLLKRKLPIYIYSSMHQLQAAFVQLSNAYRRNQTKQTT